MSSGPIKTLAELPTGDEVVGGTVNSSKGQCRAYDPTNPDKRICDDCYATLLASRCPSATAETCTENPEDPSRCCVDPAVKNNFSALVNQCISQTIAAGFTCTTTSCPATMVLNPSTCTCITAPRVGAGGAGGGATIDVGQTDYGPPVVTALLPTGTAAVTLGNSESDDGVVPNRCLPGGAVSGVSSQLSEPVRMAVRNRGDTVLMLNQYGEPVRSGAVNGAGGQLTQSALKPVPVPVGSTAFGNNVESKIGFETGGLAEFSSAAGSAAQRGGFVGLTSHISGSDGYLSTTTTYGQHTGDTGVASEATWSSPRYGARDRWGNIYFADSFSGGTGVIRVICNDVTTTTYNQWCQNNFDFDGAGPAYVPQVREKGRIYSIVGAVNGGAAPFTGGFCLGWLISANYNASGEFTGAAASQCRAQGSSALDTAFVDPAGIAVDRFANIYFTSRSTHMIGVACSQELWGWCYQFRRPNLVAGGVYRVTGEAFVSGSTDGSLTAARFNGPMGMDIQTNGDDINIYVAETGNRRLRRFCESSAVTGPCQQWDNDPNTRVAQFGGWSGNGMGEIWDVKVNRFGNVMYAEHSAETDSPPTVHILGRICFSLNRGDICQTSPPTIGNAQITHGYAAGPGSGGDGRPYYENLRDATKRSPFSNPSAIVLTEPYSDYRADAFGQETGTLGLTSVGLTALDESNERNSRRRFADNHFVVLESFYKPPTDNPNGDNFGGNTARLICGRQSSTNETETAGLCQGRQADHIYRIGGVAGTVRGGSGGVGVLATQMSFINLYGGVFDNYKNLIVSSTSTSWDNVNYLDNNLRMIHQVKQTGITWVRYSFTDSNLLTSHYCMRYQLRTICGRFDGIAGCKCELSKPYDGSPHWFAIPTTSPNSACN